jgi:hypothetical protein
VRGFELGNVEFSEHGQAQKIWSISVEGGLRKKRWQLLCAAHLRLRITPTSAIRSLAAIPDPDFLIFERLRLR